MTGSIGLYLVDFGRQPTPHMLDLDRGDKPSGVDNVIEARLAEAYRDGFQEGEAAALERSAFLEAKLASLSSQQAAEIEAARLGWVQEQGQSLTDLVRVGLADLEARLANTLAELLQPVLTTAVRMKAVDEVKQALGTLLAAGETTPIRVSGPAELMEVLKAGVDGTPLVDFAIADAPEFELLSGDTTVRSSLKAWTDGLEAAIREGR